MGSSSSTPTTPTPTPSTTTATPQPTSSSPSPDDTQAWLSNADAWLQSQAAATPKPSPSLFDKQHSVSASPEPSPPGAAGASAVSAQVEADAADVLFQAERAEESARNPLAVYDVPLTEKTPDDLFYQYWNVDHDPDKISCRVALDTFSYYALPHRQGSAYYRTGKPHDVRKYARDWLTCIQAKLMLRGGDKERVRRFLEAETQLPTDSRVRKHVWPFRAHPEEDWVRRPAAADADELAA